MTTTPRPRRRLAVAIATLIAALGLTLGLTVGIAGANDVWYVNTNNPSHGNCALNFQLIGYGSSPSYNYSATTLTATSCAGDGQGGAGSHIYTWRTACYPTGGGAIWGPWRTWQWTPLVGQSPACWNHVTGNPLRFQFYDITGGNCYTYTLGVGGSWKGSGC